MNCIELPCLTSKCVTWLLSQQFYLYCEILEKTSILHNYIGDLFLEINFIFLKINMNLWMICSYCFFFQTSLCGNVLYIHFNIALRTRMDIICGIRYQTSFVVKMSQWKDFTIQYLLLNKNSNNWSVLYPFCPSFDINTFCWNVLDSRSLNLCKWRWTLLCFSPAIKKCHILSRMSWPSSSVASPQSK